MNVRLWFASFLGVVLLLPPLGTQASEPAFRRWAILSAPEVREAGISDLLTAKLSEREFELVERDQLEAVLKELKLSQLLGSQTGERMSLGARLRADVLVLLSVVEVEQSRLLKVVISECRQGARLRAEFLPWSAAGKVAAPDELARLCEQLAIETRTQYAGGVRELVAVTPLLSKNLTRDFDHLQTGYAALLGRAISQVPGTAVVEIEEARAIGQELAVTGDGIKDRLVPLFVEGEFAMSGRAPDVRVRITLRLTDGQKERRKLERADLTLAQSVDWLMNTAPREIAARPGDSAKSPRFTREQQFEQLARRAETFSRAAAFEESTALREAALLLNDDDAEQRLWLIADSKRLMNELAVRVQELRTAIYLETRNTYRGGWDLNLILNDKVRQPLFEQARQRAQRMDESFRWLLARQTISRREATWMARDIAERWVNVRGLARKGEQDEFLAVADQTLEAMLAAYWQLDPQLRPREAHPAYEHMTLPGGVVSGECRQHDVLCQVANTYWLSDWVFANRGTPGQRLGAWQQFVKQHASPKWPSADLFMSLFMVRQLPAEDQAARQQFQEFCTHLEKSNGPLFRLYARSGRLALRMCEPRSAWDARMSQEANALQQAWDEFLKSDTHFTEVAYPLRLRTQAIAKEVEQVVRTGGAKQHDLSPNVLIGVDPDPRIAFEPLADVPATWNQWQRINDRLDVMWSANGVSIMSEPGQPRRIFEGKGRSDLVLDVCCDGRLIWVFAQESGLRAFTLEGQLVGAVFPEDATISEPRFASEPKLPPIGLSATQRQMAMSNSGAAIRLFGPTYLHPIAPGRCLVLGTYLPKQRLWIAAVSAEDDPVAKNRFRVHVVHEATIDAQRSVIGEDDNVAETFTPNWLTEIRTPTEPARRLLLVGRPQFFSSAQFKTGRRPLAVDLEALTVSVLPGRFGYAAQFGEQRYFHSGRMICSRGMSLNLLSPPQDKSALDWTRNERLSLLPPLDQREWWRMLSPTFVAVGDHLENPGPLWRRVFPAEERLEQVTPEPITPRYRFRNYSVSAHFGLVTWNSGDLAYRVHFDRDDKSPRDLAWLYPFVPPVDREAHHRAVLAIRESSGFVESVWQGLPNNWTLQPDGWATKVYLSDTWRGGDAGLASLAGLSQLRELRVVKAPITNAGLEAIGRLTSLRTLSLEETAATDAGLPQLSGLKELTNLRLENVIGGSSFTDAGLDLIHQLPHLEKLTVSGPGFTDAIIEHLQKKLTTFPIRLRDFRPLDTNISAKKLEELRARHSTFGINSEPELILLNP